MNAPFQPAAPGIRLTRKAERYLAEHEPRQTKLSKCAARTIAALRQRAEIQIEALIAFIDKIDGDPDLEPTMGYVASGYVDEAEGDNADDEASLGWTELMRDMTQPLRLQNATPPRDDLNRSIQREFHDADIVVNRTAEHGSLVVKRPLEARGSEL